MTSPDTNKTLIPTSLQFSSRNSTNAIPFSTSTIIYTSHSLSIPPQHIPNLLQLLAFLSTYNTQPSKTNTTKRKFITNSAAANTNALPSLYNQNNKKI